MIKRITSFPFQFVGGCLLAAAFLIRFGMVRTTKLLNDMGQLVLDAKNESK